MIIWRARVSILRTIWKIYIMKQQKQGFHKPTCSHPIYIPPAPEAPPLPQTPYVSVDQLQKFSVTVVYDYMRISVREGLQEG